jgi:hypothetical protein
MANACSFQDAPPLTCEANLSECTGEELGQWEERLSCLERECDDKKDATEADAACADLLEGVSWGCNPFGGGI